MSEGLHLSNIKWGQVGGLFPGDGPLNMYLLHFQPQYWQMFVIGPLKGQTLCDFYAHIQV